MDRQTIIRVLLSLLVLMTFSGCMESMVKPEAKIDTGAEMELGPYSGPRARVAVADFDWKVGGRGSTTTIDYGGQTMTISSSQTRGYTTGLRDMLTTAMVQSKRYRVLERQNIGSLKSEMALTGSGYTDSTGVKKGAIKGADLLVMGAVTGWEPGTSGGGGGLGGGGMLGTASALFGAVKGGYKKSSMAMDIRIVDANTSEVLTATRVEGVAKDVSLGGALAGFGGSGAMGGALGGFAKTPMEKAIRTCIYNATKFIAENTPQEYMKY
ncbi:MAG: CsgG/HfaB family protein [Desulfosarcina sp.]|jgi:curli biogenesis system outer membrane secretion channel CsgG